MSEPKISIGIHFSERVICASANQNGKMTKITIPDDNQAKSHKIQPIISFNKETSEIKFGINLDKDDKFTTISDFIYLLGKRYSEIEDDYKTKYNCILVKKNGYVRYNILSDNQQKVISPKEACSLLISYICSKTLVYLGLKERDVQKKSIKVIIALPSTYSLTQTDAIIQATQLAGYYNVDTITDSSAAILSCIYNKKINISQGNILSFHLMKSSFYISLLQVNKDKISLLDTISKEDIGSNQITKTLYDYILNNIKLTKGINIDKKDTQKEIFNACKESINMLSSQEECNIIIKSIPYNITIGRGQLNSICNEKISFITNTFKNLTQQNNITNINFILFSEEDNKISNLDELVGNIYTNAEVYRSEEPYIQYSEGSCIYSNYYQNKSFQYRIDDSKVSKSKAFIIDIGNNYCFGYYCNYERKESQIISKDGNDLFPSIIAYNNINSERKIGVKRSSFDKSKYTIIKKPLNYLGMKISDIYQNKNENAEYEITADIDNNCMFEVNYNCTKKYYYPTQIISLLLENMKQTALQQFENSNIRINEYFPVVMAVPIELNFIQKNEIHKAASESGLKILSLLQEPVCSLISCIENETENRIKDENCNVLVFQLCKESCKVTIMNKSDRNITILYTLCDKTVGEISLFHKIYNYIMTEINLKGIRIPEKEVDNIGKKIKKEMKNTIFRFEYSVNNHIIYNKDISEDIYTLCEDELNKIMAVFSNSIQSSGIKDIKYIILVDRGSRFNIVKETIKKEIKMLELHTKILDEINEYMIIIQGALKYEEYNKKNNALRYTVKDVLPRSINVTISYTNKQSLSYGIDLGTTISSAACVKDIGKIETLDTNTGTSSHQLPSYVSYSKDSDKIMVGEPAKNSISTNRATVLYDSKRYIGKDYSNIDEEYTKSCLYEVVNENGLPAYKVLFNNQQTTISPHIISSKILSYINKLFIPQISCNNIPTNEIQVVIGVPAIFTNRQKEDTIKAAKEAGFNNIKLIPEPSAAALAYIYSHDKMKEKDENYFLVYDFGGGTFDVSIVHLKSKIINIIATHGDDNLGGQDITKILEDYVIEKMKKEKNITDINDKLKRRIHKECEELKINLSNNDSVDVDIHISEDIEFEFEISRSLFDNLCEDIYSKTIDITLLALEKAKFAPQNIDYVIMSGGSSKIKTLKKLITEKFDKSEICDDVNSNEVVAIGCAIYAKSTNNSKYEEYIIEDKPFTSVSEETIVEENINIFKRCETLPCERSTTLNVDKGVIKVNIFEDDGFGFDQMNNIGFVSLNVSEKGNLEISYKVSEKGNMIVKIKTKNENVEKEFLI